MHITIEHVHVLQDYDDEPVVTRLYEAREQYTGLHALGSTHYQAFSNLLGLLWLHKVPVYKK